MKNINLKKIHINKYLLLVGAVFLVIFFSRVLFLGADLPRTYGTHVEIEEKPGGFNARNMVFFNRWPLYRNWFQPMVYMPLPNFISYWSFRLFGVGLAQFRFPFALAGFLGLVVFFLILSKQTNRFFALFGLLPYAFNLDITIWNRSALPENLYLFFMPLSVYFLTKDYLRNKDIFTLVFLAALNLVVKLDGYPFYLAVVFFLFPWSLATRSFTRTLRVSVLGSLASLAVLLALFAFADSFKYVVPMYRFYFRVFLTSVPLLSGMSSSLRELVVVLINIDPYILLACLSALPVLVINYQRLDKSDWFILTFLFFAVITRLRVPAHLIYWKRVMFLFFPALYLIFRSLFFLWEEGGVFSVSVRVPRKILLGLTVFFIFCLLMTPLLFYDEFLAVFYHNKGAFLYIILMIFGICAVNLALFFEKNRRLERTLASLILFLALTSVVTSGLRTSKIYLPENIKYSYQENDKYTELVPEEAMIISDEQAFRAFVYLNKHQFYFNHDGGPNPLVYREVLERKDLRYFILDAAAFEREYAGIPNKVRLELIGQAYPDLKLLGIMYASNIPLAIYDKYGDSF